MTYMGLKTRPFLQLKHTLRNVETFTALHKYSPPTVVQLTCHMITVYIHLRTKSTLSPRRNQIRGTKFWKRADQESVIKIIFISWTSCIEWLSLATLSRGDLPAKVRGRKKRGKEALNVMLPPPHFTVRRVLGSNSFWMEMQHRYANVLFQIYPG